MIAALANWLDVTEAEVHKGLRWTVASVAFLAACWISGMPS